MEGSRNQCRLRILNQLNQHSKIIETKSNAIAFIRIYEDKPVLYIIGRILKLIR